MWINCPSRSHMLPLVLTFAPHPLSDNVKCGWGHSSIFAVMAGGRLSLQNQRLAAPSGLLHRRRKALAPLSTSFKLRKLCLEYTRRYDAILYFDLRKTHTIIKLRAEVF